MLKYFVLDEIMLKLCKVAFYKKVNNKEELNIFTIPLNYTKKIKRRIKMNKENCPYLQEKCSFNFYDNFLSLPPSKKTELLIELFKVTWKKPLYWALCGLGIIFIGAIFSIFFGSNTTKSIFEQIFTALQVWVGFILGIIATIFSIISMYLSFYNLEQQNEVEKRTQELNNQLTDSLKDIITNVVLKAVRDDLNNLDNKMAERIEKLVINKSSTKINKIDSTIKLTSDFFSETDEKEN